MNSDWRLTNQMNFLFRIPLKKARFGIDSKSDHEHCEFCMAKFAMDNESLKDGYCTLDGYHWICEQCFHDFRKMFQWLLITD